MRPKTPAFLRSTTILALLSAAFAHGAALTLPAVSLRAESDIEAEKTDEAIENAVKSLKGDEREKAKAASRLKALEQQHEALDFRKRTKQPFRSERSLRQDLRRNEAQQGWQKQEDRRLDFETRRQQQEIRNQTEAWRRR